MVTLADSSGGARVLNDGVHAEDILFPQDPRQGHVRPLAEGGTAPPGYLAGCRVSTPKPIAIAKVDSRLMLLPVTEFMGELGEILMSVDQSINFSHIVHRMSFGRAYPGQRSPLDGLAHPSMQYHEDFVYFLSILPTRYRSLLGRWTDSHQYSLTGFLGQKDVTKVAKPGLYFAITVEALSLVIRQQRTGLRQFLLHLVGILGGIYTCFGLANSLVVTAHDWLTGARAARRRGSSLHAVPSSGSVSMQSLGSPPAHKDSRCRSDAMI